MSQHTRRHWRDKDFVVTGQSDAYDGKGNVNRFGYCQVCKGDMQSFAGDGKQGPIRHYNSHKAAKLRGLWGVQR